MNTYRVTTANGTVGEYYGEDIRMALAIHEGLNPHASEVVSVERFDHTPEI